MQGWIDIDDTVADTCKCHQERSPSTIRDRPTGPVRSWRNLSYLLVPAATTTGSPALARVDAREILTVESSSAVACETAVWRAKSRAVKVIMGSVALAQR